MNKKRYAGLIVKCKDKILLCKRNHEGSFPGMWSIPAGKVEDNEKTMDACKREFFEETAIDIDDVDIEFVGLVPRTSRDGQKTKGFMYVYLYNVDEEIMPDLENAIDGDEHSCCKYFTENQIDANSTGTHLTKLLKIIFQKN
jgi:ADP-ribose pyrophosphatase YjhB (NUDIX family)